MSAYGATPATRDPAPELGLLGGHQREGCAGRDPDEGHLPTFGVSPGGYIVGDLGGLLHGLGCDPVLHKPWQVGHDYEVACPRETLREAPHRWKLPTFWHGTVNQQYCRPWPLPLWLHEKGLVPRDGDILGMRLAAHGLDGRRKDRGIEDRGDHHDGPHLRVHPRPVRDYQPH